MARERVVYTSKTTRGFKMKKFTRVLIICSLPFYSMVLYNISRIVLLKIGFSDAQLDLLSIHMTIVTVVMILYNAFKLVEDLKIGELK
jgi:hypothetical protein